jgi:hypothetical protein
MPGVDTTMQAAMLTTRDLTSVMLTYGENNKGRGGSGRDSDCQVWHPPVHTSPYQYNLKGPPGDT